jgi:hypothetical protein
VCHVGEISRFLGVLPVRWFCILPRLARLTPELSQFDLALDNHLVLRAQLGGSIRVFY